MSNRESGQEGTGAAQDHGAEHEHGPHCDHDHAPQAVGAADDTGENAAFGGGERDDDVTPIQRDPDFQASAEYLENGPCNKRIRFEVAAENVQSKLDSDYAELRKSVQLPGFRKGRVPRGLLEKRFSARVEEEVRETIIQGVFVDEIKKHDLKVIGSPRIEKIEFKAGAPFRFETLFEVEPSFELGEYTGLALEARAVQVNEEDVDREIEKLRDSYSTLDAIAFGEQKIDDVVLADLRWTREGADVTQQSGVFLKIGVDRVDNIVVADLSHRLLAATQDSEFAVAVTLPEPFEVSDSGSRELTLHVRPKSMHRTRRPELNEEFLALVKKESYESLRESLRKSIEIQLRVAEEQRQESELLRQIGANVSMELPPTMLESRRKELTSLAEERLRKQGKTKEEIAQALAADGTQDEKARSELKAAFILDRIADRERLFVTEDELLARIERTAMIFGRPPAEVLEQYAAQGMIDAVRESMRREKARAFLRKKAKITPAAPAAE